MWLSFTKRSEKNNTATFFGKLRCSVYQYFQKDARNRLATVSCFSSTLSLMRLYFSNFKFNTLRRNRVRKMCGLTLLLLFVGGQINAAALEHRVVSIGGTITEIIYALGQQDRLVAVDSTSTFPNGTKLLKNIGYMRRLSAEPIIALNPSLVIAAAGSGPRTAIKQLRQAGINFVEVPGDDNPQGVISRILTVSKILGREERGLKITNQLKLNFALLKNHIETIENRPKVLFLFSMGRGTPLAAGKNTSAAKIIRLAGGKNATDDFDGYRPLSPEASISAEPEILLVTTRSLKKLGGKEKFLAVPSIAATQAGRQKKVIDIDGLLLLGFGPRTPIAIARLAAKIHPNLKFPTFQK